MLTILLLILVWKFRSHSLPVGGTSTTGLQTLKLHVYRWTEAGNC